MLLREWVHYHRGGMMWCDFILFFLVNRRVSLFSDLKYIVNTILPWSWLIVIIYWVLSYNPKALNKCQFLHEKFSATSLLKIPFFRDSFSEKEDMNHPERCFFFPNSLSYFGLILLIQHPCLWVFDFDVFWHYLPFFSFQT